MALATPVQPLFSLLVQMRSMIERMNDDAYAMPAPGRTSGGVGGHVRHCLDHIAALVHATRSGVVEYRSAAARHPRRDLPDGGAAADRRARRRLACLDASVLDEPLLVESQIDPAGAIILTRSSVCREVAFVVSHTIHHNAIVAQLLANRDVDLDARFGAGAGHADSTPRRLVCAR